MNKTARWAPTAPYRTYPKGDRRRADIVQVASTVFAAGGYISASMVQIAAACGVSRAGLLYHFPAKELLLAAVLEERDRLNGDLFFDGVDPGRDGIDYFRRMVRVTAHNAGEREIVSLFAMLAAEASDPLHPAHAYFVDRYTWLRADFDDALRDANRRGLLRSGAFVNGAGGQLVALMDGLQIQWLLEPTSVDVAESLRRRIEDLLTVKLDS